MGLIFAKLISSYACFRRFLGAVFKYFRPQLGIWHLLDPVLLHVWCSKACRTLAKAPDDANNHWRLADTTCLAAAVGNGFPCQKMRTESYWEGILLSKSSRHSQYVGYRLKMPWWLCLKMMQFYELKWYWLILTCRFFGYSIVTQTHDCLYHCMCVDIYIDVYTLAFQLAIK